MGACAGAGLRAYRCEHWRIASCRLTDTSSCGRAGSVLKGQLYGRERWVVQMMAQWNLGAALRGRGRPKKEVVNNGS